MRYCKTLLQKFRLFRNRHIAIDSATHLLLYMTHRIAFLEDDKTSLSAVDRIETLKTVSQLYETVYKHDDMSFESLQMLYLTHMQIVEQEIHAENYEAVVRKHLE